MVFHREPWESNLGSIAETCSGAEIAPLDGNTVNFDLNRSGTKGIPMPPRLRQGKALGCASLKLTALSSRELLLPPRFIHLPSHPERVQNAVISGLPAPERWFRKAGTTAWNGCGNGGGNLAGNHGDSHGVPTGIPKSGTGWGMGVAWGEGNGEISRVKNGI